MPSRFTCLAALLLAAGCVTEDLAPPGLDASVVDGGPVVRPDAGPPPEDLDGFVEHFMARGGIAGLGAAIVSRDGVAWTGAYGLADVEAGTPVTPDTIFIVASVSKTVAALGLMQVVEAGLLDLDAPVDDVLPYSVRNPAFPDDAISARMLLAHTSGLSDDFLILSAATYEGDPTVALGEFAEAYVTPGGAFFGDANWAHAPGTTYEYCNAAYALVGHLVEVAAAEPLPAHTRARLFSPLGMDATAWSLADVDEARLAIPYSWNGRTQRRLEHPGFAFYPASSLRTSPTELGRLLAAILREGELDGERVLERATVQAMAEIQFPDANAAQAIAWRYGRIGGRRWLSHTGSTFGASAIAAIDVETGVGLLVLTNSDAFLQARFGITDGSDALWEIIDRLGAEAAAFAP